MYIRCVCSKQGDAGPKAGPPGDLYVFLTVKTNKDFKREGSDIYSQVRDLWQRRIKETCKCKRNLQNRLIKET